MKLWLGFFALVAALWVKQRLTPRWVLTDRRPASHDFPQYRRAWKD